MSADNKKLKELISNYKTTFNTDTGKMVLEDLKKRSNNLRSYNGQSDNCSSGAI
jgi:hypothetical protein